MNFFLISWMDFLFLAFAGWAYWRGYRNGKLKGYQDAYQIELNDRVEKFLDKQDE